MTERGKPGAWNAVSPYDRGRSPRAIVEAARSERPDLVMLRTHETEFFGSRGVLKESWRLEEEFNRQVSAEAKKRIELRAPETCINAVIARHHAIRIAGNLFQNAYAIQ
jgi:hypothetical protein